MHDYVTTLQERLERIHHFAREHQDLMTERMKQQYDLSLRCPQLTTGNVVWLYNPQRKKGLSPKLQRPWQGPYTVTKRINDLVYRIQLRASTKPKVVHRNRLWLYSGDDPPSWFQESQCQTDSFVLDNYEQPPEDNAEQAPNDNNQQLPEDHAQQAHADGHE